MNKLCVRSLRLVSALVCVGMMGCTTLVTTTHQSGEGSPKDGVVYYLPMKQVKVTLTRKAVPTDALKSTAADLEKAKVAVQDARTRLQSAKAAAEWAENNAKNAEATNAGSPAALKARETANLLAAEVVTANQAVTDAVKKQTVLQQTYDNLVPRADANKFEDEIALAELPAIPDPTERYVATLSHWITHADTLKIGTTDSGLLKTVSGTSTDKTGAIIEDTAKAIIAGLKASVGLPAPLPEAVHGESADPCHVVAEFTKQAFTHDYTFDPSNPAEITKINCTLEQLGSAFRISVKKPGGAPAAVAGSGVGASGGAKVKTPQPSGSGAGGSGDVNVVTPQPCGCVKGLVYRRPVPWEFSISKVPDVGKVLVLVRTATILLPNQGPVMVASTNTSPLIATSYDIAFQDGMLTKWDVDRPSELYAFIQIPLNILKDVIALPTQMLQLKLDYSSKDTELLKTQKAQMEAADALKKAVQSSSGSTGGTTSANQ